MMFSKLRNLAFIALLGFSPIFLQAQTSVTPKPNWQNLDLTSDSTFGISTEKAYQELLKDKKAQTVIVAVIDGGVDITHEDLKSVIYVNKKEKAGNKKDDDKNGYKDDINGWDFIGGDTADVHYDNLELTRLVREGNAKYANVDVAKLADKEKADYQAYQDMKADLNNQLMDAQNNLKGIRGFVGVLDQVVAKIGKENPTLADFEAFDPVGPGETQIKKVITNVMKEEPDFKKFKNEQLDEAIKHYEVLAKYQLNVDYDPRSIVGDNYNDVTQRFYGNADVTGPDALHGSHVAGIIGAVRDNNLGIKGVADHVNILVVRTVPDGDERDKDVANSIRYAADNGAKVINMSFGKGYSKDKKAVDDAVKYAISKDVLLVHAAGNENSNTEIANNFPNKNYEGGGIADAWIEVGASGPVNDESLKASFSNYGKTTVDVFAPGVRIQSTVPNNKYIEEDGTSMASPVVAGLAALIRSYYPKLTAVQVKDIIMKSVVKINHDVTVVDGGTTKEVPFSDLCLSGGIVNAYNALKMAESISKNL
ncbi:MAG: S8 family peptidase [Bacteroidetes bacterium]|nr:S8 family peptidase [Bacteroidota bacterium]MBU1373597.1 S8 family peptidase [Bacteroidota bacterium]MBU1486408.1 S8 family peptidase [Bacteroidota bacterium]MBU1759979.1 S8 family peptidase [Bacteroidota bacterium]MBU2268706.1 S8 family peptidase [Bacteroidota bacterium]